MEGRGIALGSRVSFPASHCRRHGLVEIRFEIVDVFETHRQPDQAVADPEVLAFLAAEPLVGRRRRMGRQALGVSQVVGDVDNLEGIEKSKSAVTPVREFQGYDAPAGTHLTHGQFVLRMALKAGVEDAAEVASRFQMSSDRDGVFAGLNFDATLALADAVTIPIIASGGLASLADVERLTEPRYHKLAGAIAGRALYDGRLDPAAALRVLSEAA